jgi:hypothetical protein
MSMLMISSLLSWIVAGGAAYVAWRTVAEARRQSALRVAALTADLQFDDAEPASFVRESPRVATSLFETPPAESDRRGRIALVAGALVVGTVLSLVIGLSALGRSTTTEDAKVAPQSVSMPVDLMALTHERSANTVTVRGIVHNPLSGREIDHLTAVVMLYNSQGTVVASGQAPVAEPALTPGAESTFAVTLPDQATLGRYRVSFKADERVISHVDRRTTNQDR